MNRDDQKEYNIVQHWGKNGGAKTLAGYMLNTLVLLALCSATSMGPMGR